MRRRRRRHWLLPIALWASLVGRDGPAQTSSLPPAFEEMPAASPLPRRSPLGAASDLFAQTAPPAPEPIPGPAGVGFPVGGMDAVVPEGLPINLAAAMQLSGARPLDIAAAMAQVQQALALQLQAKALWIPTLNGGVTYFRHDGVQQDIFTGPNFRKGLQTFFVGGGPSLFVGLIALWLWATVLFANFAEAVAEGRGKAQADTLRRSRHETVAYVRDADGSIREIPATQLHSGDVCVVTAGQVPERMSAVGVRGTVCGSVSTAA